MNKESELKKEESFEEENLTLEFLMEKSWKSSKEEDSDLDYQLLDFEVKCIEANPVYTNFRQRLNFLYDEKWKLESSIKRGIACLEEDIAKKGRLDMKHWAARRLYDIGRLPTKERIEKIIQSNKNEKI